MSMLAERKVKKKWSLNPRGKAWSQDSNKFGQKMLEKMGWQQGKGLGPGGKGITEHIKVSFKNDSKGMGYKESNDQWTEHGDNFASLLESLNGTAAKPDEVKVNSLEKKSETSKARVHYHKFTRGKDLSRYSEKDLANIFGKKTLKESKREIEEKLDTDGIKSIYDSDLLFNAGSMRDYFKKKLPNFGKSNGFVVGKNGVLKKEDSESESEPRPSFGFGYKPKDNTEQTNNYEGDTINSGAIFFENTVENVSANGDCRNNGKEIPKATFVSYLDVDETSSNKKKKKKKRKGEESDEHSVLSPKKKSKKNDEETFNKKSKTEVEENMGLSNPAFNPLRTPIKMQKHVLNTIQESVSENSELEENSPKTMEIEAEVYISNKKYEIEQAGETPKRNKKLQNVEEIAEVYSSVEKKAKKKKNIDNGFVNDIIVDDVDTPKKKQTISSVKTESYTETEENPYEVKIKKKKKKHNPNFDDTTQESVNASPTEENPFEVKIKDKKKRRRKDEQLARENPGFNATLESSVDSSQVEVNLYEVKVKDKKKVKEDKFVLSNPSFDGSAENSTDCSQVEEKSYEVKIKDKKKKRKRDQQLALENPSFNATLESSANSSQFEVNPYEVIVKYKKKKVKEDKFALSNPSFDGSAENSTNSSQVEENPYEVKVKNKSKKKKQDMESSTNSDQIDETYEKRDKKKKKKEAFAIDNPHFDPNDSVEVETRNSTLEVKRKNKKSKKAMKGIVNPALNLDNSQCESKEHDPVEIEENDIMLNIATTPIITKSRPQNENTYSITKATSVKRTKSVRFSDVMQERIIPNNDELRNLSQMEVESEASSAEVTNGHSNGPDTLSYDESRSGMGKKRKRGLDNPAFDQQKNTLDENLVSISKTIDRYQAEVENDINEKKLEAVQMDYLMVGEVGNPHGKNERIPDGSMLKFKYAKFKEQTPIYQLNKTGSKKSYKHLIKGDIIVKFKNSNLHEITGYGVKTKSTE